MKVVKGDLLELAERGKFDVIVHGCNCMVNMGGGIAAQIAARWPGVVEEDMMFAKRRLTAKRMLGSYSSYTTDDGLVVVNAYTQYGHHKLRKNQFHCNYGAIDRVFRRISMDFNGKSIGYPQIGCGLAGGKWEYVNEIIDNALIGQDHTCVIHHKQKESNNG